MMTEDKIEKVGLRSLAIESHIKHSTLKGLVELMVDCIAEGKSVQLTGLGSITVREVKGKREVVFSPSEALRVIANPEFKKRDNFSQPEKKRMTSARALKELEIAAKEKRPANPDAVAFVVSSVRSLKG